MAEQKWLAAYLHYAEPFEALLIDYVRPKVNSLTKLPEIFQFFFIRYWHRGPHIRLRFKVNNHDLEKVKNDLSKSFEAYVNEKPSSRTEPEWVSNLDEDNKWKPNNSIHFIPYEPEIERYGGDEAIKIAERQFQYSSETILKIISEADEWDYEQAMGTAIQMHLSFAYALGMDTKEAKLFFDYIFVTWFPRAIGKNWVNKAINKNWSNIEKSELTEIKKETLGAFEKGFENQKDVLVPFCQNFWESIQNENSIPPRLKDWIKNNKEINHELLKCQQEGNLKISNHYIPPNEENIPLKNQERWKIFQSYVHMTNNRLGILNRDEGFLGYLIKESF